MAHERTELRDAVQAQLIAASTSAGSRVTKSRLAPLPQSELPALSVYTEDEVSTGKDTAPRELTRTVTLAVEGWAVATADIDDALDALALEIEEAMDSDLNFGGTAADSVLVGTEFGLKMDGNRPMGAVRLSYAVTYFTGLRNDELDDDLGTVGVNYSLGGAQAEDDQAQDIIEDLDAEE
jgi:hypothetical protein